MDRSIKRWSSRPKVPTRRRVVGSVPARLQFPPSSSFLEMPKRSRNKSGRITAKKAKTSNHLPPPSSSPEPTVPSTSPELYPDELPSSDEADNQPGPSTREEPSRAVSVSLFPFPTLRGPAYPSPTRRSWKSGCLWHRSFSKSSTVWRPLEETRSSV